MPKTKTPSKRKPNPAFMRPVQPDEKLSAIVGSKPLPRSELTKKLWDYIKKNGLQDQENPNQRRRCAPASFQRQEPGQHVRDDEARLGSHSLGRGLTFESLPTSA